MILTTYFRFYRLVVLLLSYPFCSSCQKLSIEGFSTELFDFSSRTNQISEYIYIMGMFIIMPSLTSIYQQFDVEEFQENATDMLAVTSQRNDLNSKSCA